jgi:hypothetical protein
MSIRGMEKCRQGHPGCTNESGMHITMEGITAMGRLARIDGERVGLLPGYRGNGKGLNFLPREEAADHLAPADLSGLAMKEAASLAVGI